MTEAEFVIATDRLEQFYEKELNSTQRKEWFNILKNLSKERYQKLIVEALKTCKYMPKLSEMIELNKNIIDVHKMDLVKINVPCKNCENLGLIKYFKNINGIKYEFFALCSCENAKNWNNYKDKRGENYFPDARELGLI